MEQYGTQLTNNLQETVVLSKRQLFNLILDRQWK